MDESDHAQIMHAIGRTLRERYAMTLKEPFPSYFADLLLSLEQLLRLRAGRRRGWPSRPPAGDPPD